MGFVPSKKGFHPEESQFNNTSDRESRLAGNTNAIGHPSQTCRDLSKCHLPDLRFAVARAIARRCSTLHAMMYDSGWLKHIKSCWNVRSRNCCYEPCKEPRYYSKNVQTNDVLCRVDTPMWHSYQPNRKETVGQ